MAEHKDEKRQASSGFSIPESEFNRTINHLLLIREYAEDAVKAIDNLKAAIASISF